jgi:pimeloyl-ACP methyl ester carboxylesterase
MIGRGASELARVHDQLRGGRRGVLLVLLAATLSSAAHWRDFGYVKALAPHWPVAAIDPLGHGQSDLPHDPQAYRAAGVLADLMAILDTQGTETATASGTRAAGG